MIISKELQDVLDGQELPAWLDTQQDNTVIGGFVISFISRDYDDRRDWEECGTYIIRVMHSLLSSSYFSCHIRLVRHGDVDLYTNSWHEVVPETRIEWVPK